MDDITKCSQCDEPAEHVFHWLTARHDEATDTMVRDVQQKLVCCGRCGSTAYSAIARNPYALDTFSIGRITVTIDMDADLFRCLTTLMALVDIGAPEVKGLTYTQYGDKPIFIEDKTERIIRAGHIRFYLNTEPVDMFRPLNSRDPWPLVMRLSNFHTLNMFHADGTVVPITQDN